MYAMDNVCKGDLSYYEFPPMALKPACETFLSVNIWKNINFDSFFK